MIYQWIVTALGALGVLLFIFFMGRAIYQLITKRRALEDPETDRLVGGFHQHPEYGDRIRNPVPEKQEEE